LHHRWGPRLVQPSNSAGCCKRYNDAGQQQRPPAGHADRLNGGSSHFYYKGLYPSIVTRL
jgi:hypothetical protein